VAAASRHPSSAAARRAVGLTSLVKPIVLRRDGRRDEKFLDGKWASTNMIIDYKHGPNDFVSDVSDERSGAEDRAGGRSVS
jgi:hypothetical protein